MKDLVFIAVCILHSTNCFYFSSFVFVFTPWSHYWNGRDKIQQNKDVFSRILYSSVLCCCLYYRREDVKSKDHLMMLLNMAAAVVPCVLSLCVYFTVPPYYPTARFQSPLSYIVFAEPFPDRSRPMSCWLAQMGSRPVTFLWWWPATDHEYIVDMCPLTKFEGALNLLHKQMMTQSYGWNLHRLQHPRNK